MSRGELDSIMAGRLPFSGSYACTKLTPSMSILLMLSSHDDADLDLNHLRVALALGRESLVEPSSPRRSSACPSSAPISILNELLLIKFYRLNIFITHPAVPYEL